MFLGRGSLSKNARKNSAAELKQIISFANFAIPVACDTQMSTKDQRIKLMGQKTESTIN
jgi:hypothetical protein